jgi:hypothetical protein
MIYDIYCIPSFLAQQTQPAWALPFASPFPFCSPFPSFGSGALAEEAPDPDEAAACAIARSTSWPKQRAGWEVLFGFEHYFMS